MEYIAGIARTEKVRLIVPAPSGADAVDTIDAIDTVDAVYAVYADMRDESSVLLLRR